MDKYREFDKLEPEDKAIIARRWNYSDVGDFVNPILQVHNLKLDRLNTTLNTEELIILCRDCEVILKDFVDETFIKYIRSLHEVIKRGELTPNEMRFIYHIANGNLIFEEGEFVSLGKIKTEA